MYVEMSRNSIEAFEFDNVDNMFIDYYYYIFGMLHTQSDISVTTDEGLKGKALFVGDIDVGAFEECILDEY